jgi:hypothetical protein
MNVAELREELKGLIASRIRIDNWGVNMPENDDNPESPASIGLDEPARFSREGLLPGQYSPNPVVVTATFPFQVLYQFGSYYTYNQIPRGVLEAKFLELEVFLEHELPCLLGSELAPDSLKLSSSVAIARAENKSWLAVCKFSIRLGLLSELDDFELYAPSISGSGDVTPSGPINPTDSFIPRFTVNPALANPTNTGTLNQLLSWVTGRIKAIAGTASWFDAPATDLATAAAHIADGNNPHEVTVDQIGAVATSDARLTDTRTPTDGTVTNAKVASDAAIAWSKVNKSGAVAADVGAVAVSARGAANGVAALDSSGLVPAAQSRPSSVSYNSGLGQFTFTWADGSSQTIDTPIENLFQSVAYNPSTQVVTFTLASGSTVTIDLSSLVDLPEVEISNQAPSASPSSGRRVFFNSTSGEYWLNVSSAWTGPFLSLTSAERSKLAGIATGATANSTDAQLRDRSTHTGSQATSTITGLDATLASFAASGHSHSNASGSAAGFMSIVDFTKLSGIATGATANSTDAQLRDRSTHTGAQATSTITGLDAALAGFAASGHSHSNASGSAAGFMSIVDFTKLSGIATGATANSTDAQLRDRSTHTGTQANTTITGLGSLSTQNANNVAITGGAINGTPIGATTPGTVVGTTLNGFTVARSATGQAIGSVCTSTGTSWAAIAGNNTTMASTTGSNWIAIGPLAGAASTTGNSWIGLGSGAGRNNTTGSQWIGIGTNTGQSNITGGNWIAIGANAGAGNTTGNNWIGIGVGAGQANVAGSGWTAIGTVAGNANSGGSNWVAVGEGAGTSNTTGTNWAAVGMQSARFNTTGSAFSAFGFRAGTANTTGSGWTALGNQAAFASTTGERFTAVGASSGLNVTTGSDWVAIGHNTMLGVTTGSGNTVIGANVTGLDPALTNNVILASGDGAQKIRIDSANAMTILGSLSNPGLAIAATGEIQSIGVGRGSVAGGARGAGATDLQTVRTLTTAVAAAANSVICGGTDNRIGASATGAAIVGGSGAITNTGVWSFIGCGQNNQVSGGWAAILGGDGNFASGNYSVALGVQANASRRAQLSLGAGRFAVSGDAQASILVARNVTTNTSTANLFLDGPTGGDRVTLANNTSFAYDICISAHSTTNIAEQATFWRRGKIYRGANAAATAIVPGEIADNQTNGLPWAVSLSADTTHGSLSIVVQGEASKTIRWVARIIAGEIAS